MAIKGYHHVQIAAPAGSEDAMRGFYGGVLGFTEIPKPEELAKRGGAWFRGPGLELHVGIDAEFRAPKKAHPAFLVDDLDALAEQLRAAGHEVTPDGLFPGYRRFYATDPAGNRLEFLQPA
ncbi:VOC family protein [Actinomadura rupiterrae]|uniref:VOC family protein n=1 Tax=Actinomadura rupiterrae TaxID=559627 RepID=UPI0020A344B5|nr:VOC family protein [Actinomadura rupiterrae]MCP2336876.1 catechol 2,3-dioxygenase-like lactoylglutathione lyase family enzyme [Actinomadura rupiterrae]